MGIYLPNMEMPTEEEIGKCIIVRHDGEVWIVEFDNLVDGGYVACYPTNPMRAVPVPPHGRLGDLDKLVEKIDGIWDCNDMVFKPNDHCCNIPEDCKGCKWVETKNFIRRIVANAPTIIPASKEGEI